MNSCLRCLTNIATGEPEQTKSLLPALLLLIAHIGAPSFSRPVYAKTLSNNHLSNEEINALREEELNEQFFKALSHVQEIHAICKILMRTHHQEGFRSAIVGCSG
ncbi:hypothetical protein MKW98_026969 [Papaver atlanticum]|uniref:Uncharacterized protein n=1 Tax=Papaver atlanticum TaxID=357466 RepID=A0AAD4XKN6_9MAGN|nr:hypothetical protein MKW98_026969 [Papaver atlanticum]